MRRILIAGCGYVGQATADLFHRAGWKVEGWTKSKAGTGKPYPIHAIDITDAKQVHACEGNFDVVVHCASTRGGHVDLYRRVYLNGARNLLETFVTSTILFTSSTSVYAQINGERVTEESAGRAVNASAMRNCVVLAGCLAIQHSRRRWKKASCPASVSFDRRAPNGPCQLALRKAGGSHPPRGLPGH